MADEEQLERLLRSVEEWNEWRRKNWNVAIDLSNADLNEANLIGADLKEADLREANLISANLISANLISADLKEASLISADLKEVYLREANLISANLISANFSKSSLFRANFSHANLSHANLSRTDLGQTQVLNTNFEGATLTGACIEDWNINSNTNLNKVICECIYFKLEYGYQYTDRRPSDPSKIFAPGDFARLVQKSLDTVDLIFREGIDWKAFSTSFQALKAEQVKVEGDDRAFSVRAIENLDDGSFVVRINTPKDADKAEIEREFWARYQPLLETQNKQLAFMGEQLQCERGASKELRRIIQTMVEKDSNTTIYSGDRIENSQIGATRPTLHDNAKVAHTINEAQSQDLASAAKEIQELLDQLSETYPTTTLSEKSAVAEKAIAHIKSDRNWLGKVVRIIKAMGKEAFFEAIDHPAANVLRAGFEELLSTES